MSEYATIEHYVNHVMAEITKRDVEQVSEKLRALGWEEVVRCHNCKHYDRMNDDEGMCMVPDDDGDYARWMVDAVGYCYLGERREV